MSAEPITNYETLVADLRQEVSRLQSELDEATKQGVRAAEYGLAVLEEKNQLQQHCESLETLYDTTKHELQCTKRVSVTFCITSIIVYYFLPVFITVLLVFHAHLIIYSHLFLTLVMFQFVKLLYDMIRKGGFMYKDLLSSNFKIS